jgi:hypothetical protein
MSKATSNNPSPKFAPKTQGPTSITSNTSNVKAPPPKKGSSISTPPKTAPKKIVNQNNSTSKITLIKEDEAITKLQKESSAPIDLSSLEEARKRLEEEQRRLQKEREEFEREKKRFEEQKAQLEREKLLSQGTETHFRFSSFLLRKSFWIELKSRCECENARQPIRKGFPLHKTLSFLSTFYIDQKRSII